MSRWAALALLVACGDNTVPLTARPESGRRLLLQRLEYDDGTRQLASTREVFDAARDEPCTITRWSDGLRYCTPAARLAVFADDTCTLEVGRVRAGETDARYFLREFFLNGQRSPSRLYERGDPITDEIAATFELRDGGCVARTDFDAGDTYETLGAEIDRTALVHTLRKELATGDRLDALIDTSPDGLVLPAGLFDLEQALDCVPDPLDATTAACALLGIPPSIDFGDATCSEPVALVATNVQPPDLTARVSPVDLCTRYHPLGELRAVASTFRRSGRVCTEVPLPLDQRVFALAPPIETATLVRVRLASERRLSVIEDGATGFPDRFLFDTTSNRECQPTPLDTTRCVPAFHDGVVRYRDALCLEELLVAEVLPRCGLPFELARHPIAGSLHAIGEVSPTVFEITTGDRCVEAIPANGGTFHETGEAIPPTAFPAATRVID